MSKSRIGAVSEPSRCVWCSRANAKCRLLCRFEQRACFLLLSCSELEQSMSMVGCSSPFCLLCIPLLHPLGFRSLSSQAAAIAEFKSSVFSFHRGVLCSMSVWYCLCCPVLQPPLPGGDTIDSCYFPCRCCISIKPKLCVLFVHFCPVQQAILY